MLIFLSPKQKSADVKIHCVNLESSVPDFEFDFNNEKNAVSEFSQPLKYLYLPNNSVLKSGAFNTVADRLKLRKLHANSHFYTSNELVTDFPGRVLQIDLIDSKMIKKGEKFNIVSKNYPLSPDDIKKKYKISDGGKTYLIFTQTQKGKIILRSIE